MRVSWDFWQVFHEGPTVFWLCFMCFMDVSELVTRKKEVACKRIDISKTDSPRIEAKKTFISKTC